MKQVMLTGAGETVVREIPHPACKRTTVLVRNRYSAISSGTERSRVETGQKSLMERVRDRPELAVKAVNHVRKEGLRQTRELVQATLAEESPSGYSSAGVVLEVGTAVRGLAVGDVVACGGAGYANHAEVVSVPQNLCVRVPSGVTAKAASLTTIASIALHGVRLSGVELGDRVAVVGCGLVGQMACRLLVAAGTEVIALDPDEARVGETVAGGAHHGVSVGEQAVERVRALTGGVGADRVVVTAASASSEPLILAADVARDRASIILVGAVPVEVPRELFFSKELAFRVSRSYGPGRYDAEYEERGLDYPIGYVRWTERRNMECILDLQARGALVLEDLIEEVVPVERAAEAYDRLAGKGTRPRGALVLSYSDQDDPRPAGTGDPKPRKLQTSSHACVQLGLIGPGSFAKGVLVPAFQAAGAEIAGVAGGSGASAVALARQLGDRPARSPEDLIDDATVDALVIASRHGSHAKLAEAGLRAGKHVFCEKPLALDEVSLGSVTSAAKECERILTVGFNRRFSPHLERAQAFLAEAPGARTAVYRISAGTLPASHWIHDLDEGGGRVVGEVCHFIDALVFIFRARVVRVHASGFDRQMLPAQGRDNVVLTLDFADGSVGSLVYTAGGASAVGKERLEVFGEDRTVLLDDFMSLELFQGDERSRTRSRRQDKGHEAEARAFIEAVRAGQAPIPLVEVLNVHLTAYAAVESLLTGRPVELQDLGSGVDR